MADQALADRLSTGEVLSEVLLARSAVKRLITTGDVAGRSRPGRRWSPPGPCGRHGERRTPAAPSGCRGAVQLGHHGGRWRGLGVLVAVGAGL